ncbi:MAG: SHOCT domain-containing protein [Desulfosarcinaceae bacterium]|nr:SHOCT domain-containing protein [Desulfosarcinaceae bacterium]
MFKRQKPKKESDGLLKSVLMAYLVLALHVLVIAMICILVIFFRGIVNYMLWIFLAITLLILASGYYFYRRMRAEGKNLREMMHSPLFAGRSVEVSFMGGFASIRLNQQGDPLPPAIAATPAQMQLEDPETQRIRQLTELAGLLERDLISREEYDTAKQQLLKPSP